MKSLFVKLLSLSLRNKMIIGISFVSIVGGTSAIVVLSNNNSNTNNIKVTANSTAQASYRNENITPVPEENSNGTGNENVTNDTPNKQSNEQSSSVVTTTQTTEPTVEPTTKPVTEPTVEPTTKPTTEPTVEPTTKPTTEPTAAPTTKPTTEPTAAPTTKPTTEPTTTPTTTKPSTNTEEPDMPTGWKDDIAAQALAVSPFGKNNYNYIVSKGDKLAEFDSYFNKLVNGSMSGDAIRNALVGMQWRELDYTEINATEETAEITPYTILNSSTFAKKYTTKETDPNKIYYTIGQGGSKEYVRMKLYWNNNTKEYTVYILCINIG